jgi:ribosomal protein L28
MNIIYYLKMDKIMRKCMITGKINLNGCKVSHSNIKTKHKQQINIHSKRIFDINRNIWVKIKTTVKGMRIYYKTISTSKK